MKAAPAKKSRKDMPSETGAMMSRTPSCRSAASDGTMSMVTAMEIRKQTALMYNATSGDVSDTTTPAAADPSMVANLPRGGADACGPRQRYAGQSSEIRNLADPCS